MSRLFNMDENKKSFSSYLTGWFKHKNKDDVTLRITHNDTQLPGSLRFNKYNAVFQGFNGNNWVDLNASKGDKGDIGEGFKGHLKLDKIGDGINLFRDDILNLSVGNNDLNDSTVLKVRSLKGGTVSLNEDDDGSIQLNSIPQPFTWDNSGKTIEELKENIPYGDTSIFTVVKGECEKGQVVIYKLMSDKKTFGIAPCNSFGPDEEPFICGVAINNAKEGENCTVCTHGITIVKISSNIGNRNYHEPEITFGDIGYLGQDGKLFNSYKKDIKIGTFMEEGEFNSDDEILFFVS